MWLALFLGLLHRSHSPLNLQRLLVIVSSSGPITAIVEESHTKDHCHYCRCRESCPIMLLQVPLWSSCPNLLNCGSLAAIRAFTRPHTSPKQSAWKHMPHAPSFTPSWRHPWCYQCHVIPSLHQHPVTCLRHFADVIFVDFCWQALIDFDHWLFAWLTVDFNARVDFLPSRCSLSSFSSRFHFCSPFLHILLLNEEQGHVFFLLQ